MADNVTIPAAGTGTTTPVVATDDISSVHYQKIKIALGADGAVDTLLDAGQQLSADSAPVVLASDHPDIKITLDGEQVVISGTVQVQSNSANLATEATAAAIQAAVEIVDNAISGSEMQVDLVAGGPIGATTDAEATGDGTVIAILKRIRTLIGDIFSTVGNIYTSLGVLTMGDNSAYTATMDRVFAVGGYMDDASPDTLSEGNIGTLRVTTNRAVHVNLRDASGNELTPGGTQYTEDAAAAANPTGTALIMVRDDSRVGSITNADGDNVAARGNNKGEQYVKDTDAAALLTTLTGALASVGTDTLLIAEPLQTQSNGADIATETTAAAIKTAVEVVDDWDESDRAKVNLIPGQAGITAGAGAVAANTPRVTLASDDPAVGALNDIFADTSDMRTNLTAIADATKIEDGAAANGDRGIPALAVRRDTPTGIGANGDYAMLGVDSSGRLHVVDADVTSAISELLNALSSYDGDAILTGGDISHDSPDGNKPVKIGHVAKNFDGSAPGTPVAEEDRVNSIADVYGRQYVEITHPAHWTVSADYASAQTNTSLKSAPGAGLKLYITDVIVSNGATAGNITLLDGSGGTVKLELYPGVNGGLAHSFRTPIALSANTALCITSTTVTTHSVTICGYTAP